MASLVNLEAVTGLRGGFLELLLADRKYILVFFFDKGNLTDPRPPNLRENMLVASHAKSIIICKIGKTSMWFI